MKKKLFLIFATIIMFNTLFLLNSTNAIAKQKTPKLSSKNITLNVGAKKTLKVKKSKKNAKISWKSNKPKIVTVSKKGVIFAKSPGNAVIKATIKQKGKKTVLKCKVKVQNDTKTPTSPLPLSDKYKKNTLFDTYLTNGVSMIHYNINDNSYVVTDQKKISAILAYMSLLEIEQTKNPNVMGGFSMTLSVPNQPLASIGLLSDTFNINGQYYKIKNSNLDITTVIKLFLGI